MRVPPEVKWGPPVSRGAGSGTAPCPTGYPPLAEPGTWKDQAVT